METENQKDRTMAENTETKRSAFVERLPGLTNSKWGGISKEDGSKIVAAIFKQGSGAIKELISGLREVDSGEDWQERLLLHQLAVQSGAPSRAKPEGPYQDLRLGRTGRRASHDTEFPVAAVAVCGRGHSGA